MKTHSTESPSTLSLKVVAYNLWNYSHRWPERREMMLALLRNEDPDVIALQEVRHTWHDLPGHNQARQLGDRLGYQQFYRPANMFWPLPPVWEGLAFLFKRKPTRGAYFPVPHPPRSGPRRIILETAFGSLRILNVHFPLSESARLAESDLLIQIAKREEGPVLAMGDFNADPDGPPMRRLFNAGFVDLWTALNGSSDRWPEPRRIDYILGLGAKEWSGSVKVVGACGRWDGLRPSDHVGLSANLSITS